MTPPRALLLGALLLQLAAAAAPARAIDPPTVSGHLQYGDQRYDLRHAQAVRSPGDSSRIWIVLTTAELPVRDAADVSRTLALAASGKLRGVRLVVSATAPDRELLQGALLLGKAESPGGEIVFGMRGGRYWERLSVGDNRIVGVVRHVSEAGLAGSPEWSVDARFSAPVFNVRR